LSIRAIDTPGSWVVIRNIEQSPAYGAVLGALLDELRPDPAGSYRRLITHVKDRPGHDRRYAIDSGKIQRELGWQPRTSLAEGLEKTVMWYLAHRPWCERITVGGYRRERLGLAEGVS